MKKKYAVLFERLEDFHFSKEVGMIPAAVKKASDWETVILAFNNPNLTHLNGEDYGVKVELISNEPDKQSFFQFLQVLFYIIRHAKSIAVLEFIHCERRKAFYSFVYKLLNKSGKIFLKLDSDTERINHQLPLNSKNPIKHLALNFKRKLLKNSDIIGVETRKMHTILSNAWPGFASKIEYIPSGILVEKYSKVNIDNNIAKENIILTVGRIGSIQKNNEALLETFVSLNPENWKLRFVGPFTSGFEDLIIKTKNENPHLSDSIQLVGPVWNFQELLDEYRKAKIFCLTSLYGSFELVLVEAAALECSIVTYDVGVASDLIKSDDWGKVVDVGDCASFQIELSNEIQKWEKRNRNLSELRNKALNDFSWNEIGKKITTLFNETTKK